MYLISNLFSIFNSNTVVIIVGVLSSLRSDCNLPWKSHNLSHMDSTKVTVTLLGSGLLHTGQARVGEWQGNVVAT